MGRGGKGEMREEKGEGVEKEGRGGTCPANKKSFPRPCNNHCQISIQVANNIVCHTYTA